MPRETNPASRPSSRVRERIEDQLGADRLHGLAVTRRQDETVYCVAAVSTTMDRLENAPDMEIPVLDVRTVVVDFDQDAVRVSDNGLWVPHDRDVAQNITQLLARSTTDLANDDTDTEPATLSATTEVDVDLFLDREIQDEPEQSGRQHRDKMQNHTGIDPAREWGYGAGPPPEVHDLIARLEEASLGPAEHLTRLVWGKKEPMDRRPRPLAELTGNYGIELLPRDYGLIAIDVDYPEEFPEFVLPPTLEVSSPHGDDTQRHIILKCEEKGRIADELGAWAVQSTPWGDLWIGDRYLVGPGSQLSEFGCDDGDHQRGERGGCSACTDPNSGYYEVVSDAPIATVDAQTILDLLDASEGYDLRERDPAAPDPEDTHDIQDDESGPHCDNCGEIHESEDEMKILELGDQRRRICRGGCGGETDAE